MRVRWAVRFWNPLLCVIDLLFTERSCAKKGMVVAKKGSFGSGRIVLGMLECFQALNYPDMGHIWAQKYTTNRFGTGLVS